MRKLLLLALGLVGTFDSAFLWWSYASPDHPMVCVGGGCDAVRASSYAHVAGIPTPVFGVVMYVTLVLLFFAEGLMSSRWARTVQYAVAGISGLGFLVSVYLTGIEAFVLHAWCVWCVVSAVAVTAIFLLSLVEVFYPSSRVDGEAAIAALRRRFVVLVTAVLIGVPAFLLLARSEKLPPTKTAPAAILNEHLIRPDSHVYGNSDSPVTVVEFGDFQCPYCRTAEKTVLKIREAYASRVRFVFRQFPITAIHQYAEKAAEASECAGEQGAFWPAFDKLYSGDGDLTEAALKRYARELGLDMNRFNQCLDTGATKPRIERDIKDARAIGVSRTPTFFIDGKKFEGGLDYAQFSALLNRELALHGATGRQAAQQAASPAAAPGSTGAAPAAAPAALGGEASAGGGLLGNPNANVFSAGSSSLTACSEDEAAAAKQPTLIDTVQARHLFEDGSKTLFVDVRPASAYQKASIRGAINMPVEEIEKGWSRLPKDRAIVLYESGHTAGTETDPCAAGRAVGRFLLAHGFSPARVKVYRDGLAAWEKAGLPMQQLHPPVS